MPPPPDDYPRKPKRLRLVLVAIVLVVVGLGAYLLWPAPTLDDEAAIDAALPTEHDLPGFIPFDGLTGALSPPTGHKSGRTVLTGDELAAQCETYRAEKDGWACADLRGMGWVVLERAQNVFFRVLSTVLAYPDEDAAEAAYQGLVADNRREVPDDHTESEPGLGDESISFRLYGVTAFAVRVDTVVVEMFVQDGSDQVPEAAERAMAEKWPNLQLDKLEAALD